MHNFTIPLVYETLLNIFEVPIPKIACTGRLITHLLGNIPRWTYKHMIIMYTNFLSGLTGTQFNGINLTHTVDGDCTMYALT